MRALLVLLICSFENVVFSDWKLATIYNQSDLHLDGAYRLINGKRGKPKKASTFVDRRIKSATEKPFIIIDYTVPTHVRQQGHLCISAKNSQGQLYVLSFDSRPKHAMIWNRLQTKDVATYDGHSDILSEVQDGALIARAVLTLNEKVVDQSMQSYEVDFNRVGFDLTIYGKDGSYTIELSTVE